MMSEKTDHEAIEALAAGFYRKELWAVITRPVGDPATLAGLMLAHLTYQVELEKKGVLFAAGPLTPAEAPAPNGTGLFVLRAADELEARALCDADPLHKAGLRTYELYRWTLHEGRITIAVSLSDSSVTLT